MAATALGMVLQQNGVAAGNKDRISGGGRLWPPRYRRSCRPFCSRTCA